MFDHQEIQFGEIQLMYKWKGDHGEMGTLEDNLTIEGLVKGGDTLFINLFIEAENLIEARNETIGKSCRLGMKNLISFQAKYRKIEIFKEIGCKYYRFGINLLNDDRGTFITSIEHKFRSDPDEINLRILQEWVSGRGKPLTWDSLIEVLRDIELDRLADEIAE